MICCTSRVVRSKHWADYVDVSLPCTSPSLTSHCTFAAQVHSFSPGLLMYTKVPARLNCVGQIAYFLPVHRRPCISSSDTRNIGSCSGELSQGFALPRAVGRTAYSYETSRLIKTILTRQAVKTVLNYLSETNGELHYFLHNYVSENPIPLSGDTDADAWLVALASSPLTSVQDPRRSSVASVAAAAAVTQGKREVSPRDVAERIMGLREHIAQEVTEELAGVPQANMDVRRKVLEKTVTEFKVDT